MTKAIISLSGGMDSATVLAEAISQGRACMGVGFYYGSKHNQYENAMAQKLANHYSIPYQLLNLEGVMKGFKSSLMLDGGDIPEGHYENENMSETVVPARNIIFISILAGVAWSNSADEVWVGIHAGDHAIYPDCRPPFALAMNDAICMGTGGKVVLKHPFLHATKTQILQIGIKLRVPHHLTRTCYKNQEKACGVCGSCRERLEAFSLNGIKDPIEYEE